MGIAGVDYGGIDRLHTHRKPAPRWSAYVHELRKMGVEIETIHEAHGGKFPGHHARYVLRCDVKQEGRAA